MLYCGWYDDSYLCRSYIRNGFGSCFSEKRDPFPGIKISSLKNTCRQIGNKLWSKPHMYVGYYGERWLTCNTVFLEIYAPDKWKGKVVRMAALVVTGDVEGKLQRPQWRPRQSPWRPFHFCGRFALCCVFCGFVSVSATHSHQQPSEDYSSASRI